MAALRQHCLKANYQTCIWRLCQEQTPITPSPVDHGWVFDEDGLIGINWMNCQPAPEEVRIDHMFLLICVCAFPNNVKLIKSLMILSIQVMEMLG